jgi:hypothetical protein
MAGRVVTETGGSWGLTNQLTTTTYYNTGAIKGVTSGDNDGTASDTDYEVAGYTYDAAGNRLTETLSHTYSYLVSGSTYAQITLSLENEVATWDDDHRMLTVKDLSGAQWTATSTGVRTAQTGDPFSITYWYDLDGNIRRMQSTYDMLTATGTDTTAGGEDYWYTYDAMNRFVITRGAMSGTIGTGTIVTGTTGTSMTYNRDGTRATVTNGVDGTMETDTYTAAGLLGQVQVGSFVRGTYAYDAYGRAWDYTEYDATVAHNVIYDRVAFYNGGGVVTQDEVTTKRGSTTTLVNSSYTYNVYGQVSTVEAATQTNGGTPVDSETRYYYFTFDGASETASVYYSPNLAGPPVTYVTGYAYDGLGRLKEIDVSDGHPRTLLYQSDLTGQIIRRDQVGTAPHEVHYYFNGIQVGDVSNNGAGSDLDYAQEIADRTATITTGGPFHNGGTTPTAYANFDQSYNPLNGYDANSASGSYTVTDGDTLQSIAAMEWGDGSLWYLIADANGLSGDDTLTTGWHRRRDRPAWRWPRTLRGGACRQLHGAALGLRRDRAPADRRPAPPRPDRARSARPRHRDPRLRGPRYLRRRLDLAVRDRRADRAGLVGDHRGARDHAADRPARPRSSRGARRPFAKARPPGRGVQRSRRRYLTERYAVAVR